MAIEEKILAKLTILYGETRARAFADRLFPLLNGDTRTSQPAPLRLSERDAMVIAYGDHVQRPGETPLRTLGYVLRDGMKLPVSSLHILPFYPYSSDDGFSVIDYLAVNPELGTWDDVYSLSRTYRLMYDAVFNHVSAKSDWFQAFLRDETPYNDFFVTASPEADLSLVVRPRTHPLLTAFNTAQGVRHVWTTFSDDQIDLNAANPDLLLELIKILLFYAQSAAYIRLDAIAFLWKEIGTSCIHLPNTHLIIQLMRDVLDIAAPDTLLITETNVPHIENLSYFGDGTNEAQLVYQFALPPLILHTLRTGNAARLTEWAKTIRRVSDRTTFFNFTASHDGIGVRPVKGILTEDEIAALVQMTQDHGGHVSMKSESDGSKTPYEMNITYFDAITSPEITAKDPHLAISRFVVSQAIMLAMIGVPGIYFGSLFGSRNDHVGVQTTARYRTINREKFDADQLLSDIKREDTLRYRVFTHYHRLLEVRTAEPAFHPLGNQNVWDVHPSMFVLERISPDGAHRVIALHNVSGETASAPLPEGAAYRDLFSGETVVDAITLAPYQVAWLKAI